MSCEISSWDWHKGSPCHALPLLLILSGQMLHSSYFLLLWITLSHKCRATLTRKYSTVEYLSFWSISRWNVYLSEVAANINCRQINLRTSRTSRELAPRIPFPSFWLHCHIYTSQICDTLVRILSVPLLSFLTLLRQQTPQWPPLWLDNFLWIYLWMWSARQMKSWGCDFVS